MAPAEMTPPADIDVPCLIVAELGRTERQAAAVSELAALARRAGIDDDRLERGLAELERAGRVVVLQHLSPDPHLDGVDLRTVGVAGDSSAEALERARQVAQAHWEHVLREFLASHRCC